MALAHVSLTDRKEALVLLQDFRTLQEERTRQYNRLADAHKVYLESGKAEGGRVYDLDTYKLAVKDSTDNFQAISSKIKDITKKLEAFVEKNGGDSTRSNQPISFIQHIQEYEEQKLRLTVDLQLAKQQAQEAPDDEEELQEKNVKGISTRLNEVMGNITDIMEEIRYFVADVKSVDEEECDSR